MELKKGYKQTEVGIIPEDWDVKLVEEIAEVKSGKRLPLGKSLIENETLHPYIRVIDMFQGGVLPDNIKYVPDDVYPLIKNYRIFKDDIFISVAGTLGMVGKIPIELDGANLTENANRLTSIKCNRDYLLNIFTSSLIQQTINSERTLGAQPKLALTRIRKFLIPLPSTEIEQQTIAIAIGDVDELISSLERLIAKKQNIKQGTMQQLFTGKKRLPGFSGKWVTKKLGDLTELYQPITISASHFKSHGFPVYGANGVVGFYDQFNHETWQVTVTCRGSTCGTVNRTVDRSWITGNAMVVNCDGSKQIEKTFLYYLLASSDLSVCITGTGQPQIVRSPLANFDLTISRDLKEQTAIAQVLSDMDTEIEALGKKRDKYKSVKQGMMQELLSGKTRLI